MNNSKRKLRRQLLELPRWLSDKESSWQYRRHRFNPWPGKIPHAVEQMNHNYSALMQQLPKPTDLKSPCSTAREATAMRSPCTATTESPPLSAAREKAHPAKKTQHKKKKWKKKRESNSYIYPHGSQQTVENTSRDENTRPPDLSLEKPLCMSRSNS